MPMKLLRKFLTFLYCSLETHWYASILIVCFYFVEKRVSYIQKFHEKQTDMIVVSSRSVNEWIIKFEWMSISAKMFIACCCYSADDLINFRQTLDGDTFICTYISYLLRVWQTENHVRVCSQHTNMNSLRVCACMRLFRVLFCPSEYVCVIALTTSRPKLGKKKSQIHQ